MLREREREGERAVGLIPVSHQNVMAIAVCSLSKASLIDDEIYELGRKTFFLT